jgi:hypothetical protein
MFHGQLQLRQTRTTQLSPRVVQTACAAVVCDSGLLDVLGQQQHGEGAAAGRYDGLGVEMGVIPVLDIGAVHAEDVLDSSGREVIDNEISDSAPGCPRCPSMLVIRGHTFLPTASFNKTQSQGDVSSWFKTEEPRPPS